MPAIRLKNIPGFISISSGSNGAWRITAASGEKGSVESPWNERAQSILSSPLLERFWGSESTAGPSFRPSTNDAVDDAGAADLV